MELKVLREGAGELELEFVGEGHTFMNLLKSSLLEDPDVLVATYDIKFPTISNPIMYIRTKEGDRGPRTILKDAVDRIISKFDELTEAMVGVLV
ncbi:DNA-directed RNA polymerase subunit L [Methanosarcinales archaeon]|nr:MAG: DNA-directed RNA polymerase subunit L [Methanosarcinales archaeon]